MKNKTMKKALSLFLAVLTVALAIPFTVLPAAADGNAASITGLTFVGYADNGKAITFGSYPLSNAIDRNRGGAEAWTNDCTLTTQNVKLGEDGFEKAVGEGTFYGAFIAELDALSKIDTVSIWSPYPKANKDFVNDGYQIYYSTDGKTYTLAENATFTDMCGNGSKAGANSGLYKGSKPYGHEIDMNGVTAKYIAVAVTAATKNGRNNMSLGELEVVGTHRPKNGDVLYEVDFNSTKAGYTFSDGTATNANGNWSKTNAVTSADGKSVTIKSTTSNEGSDGKAKYWTKFTDYYVGGNSFTIEFTLDSTVPVGILLDCGSGFVINPSTNTTWMGHYQVKGEFAGAKTYEGSSNSKQTYAIELTTAAEAKANIDGYITHYPTVYKLYVKNETTGMWELVRNFPANKANEFEWEVGGWEILYMGFARYDGDSDTEATISDVTIYNGINVLNNHLSYENAEDGDLLYSVSFNASESGFRFSDGTATDSNGNWSKTNAVTSADGKSVTIKSTTSNSGSGTKAKYWTKFTEYTVGGNSYTMVFTLDSTVPVGIILDCGAGFVINPSTNTTWIGRYAQKNGVAGEKTYDGTANSKQTYAIELSNAATTEKNHGNLDAYYPTVYKLYVQDDIAGTWTLVREVLPEQAHWFEWEAEGGYDSLYMGFARYDGNSTTESTVSNVKLYKGNDLLDMKFITGEDANVLYEVDFSSTEEGFIFSDGWSSWASETGAVVSSDGKSVTIKSTNSKNLKETELMAMYGAQFTEFTVGGNSFTVEFTLDSTVPVGILLDCGSGFVINPSTNTTSIGRYHVETEIAGEQTYEGTPTSKQTYAIELRNADTTQLNHSGKYQAYYPTVYKLYVKNEATGTWEFIREITSANAKEFEWETGGYDNLFMRFARYDGVSDVESTISNVVIKEGIGFLTALKLMDGAQARISAETSGLRFTGVIGKHYLDALKAKYGEENVTVGMLITPTDYLTDNDLAFNKYALDNCEEIVGVKYIELDAAPETIKTSGTNYKFNCAIVNIKVENYGRAFSAVLYIKITNGESTNYIYSATDGENSRTISYIAERAYADLADVKDTVKNGLTYSNPVVVDETTTKYSPYTEEERKILYDFFQ